MKKILTSILFFILLLKCGMVNAQGGDNCAGALASPITLPFTAAGKSTCSGADDYNATVPNMTVPTCITPNATKGMDWLYYFTSSASGGPILIQLSNITPTPADVSITLWTGCPSTGTCVEGISGWTDGSTMMQFNSAPNTGYYIMIDCWPSPNCVGYNISIDYTPKPPVQPSCTNIDFEQGNFSGWYGTAGRTGIACGIAGAPRPNYDLGVPGTPSTQHTIMSGAGVDPCGGFPVVCPAGGGYSVRLGDIGSHPVNTWNGMASLQQTFNVTPANAYVTYWYAVVVQNGITPVSHNSWEQPFFQIEVLDCNGNQISCGGLLVVGGPNIPGFAKSTGCNPDVYYKGWTPVALDLSSHIGSCITIRFVAGDCCFDAHYAYAYVDLETCKPLPTLVNYTVCAGDPATLTGPNGFSGYSWSNGGNTQNITITPTSQTTYSVTLISAAGPGCVTVLTDTVFVHPLTTVSITPVNAACGTPGSAQAVISGGTLPHSYSWSNGQTTTAISGLSAGTYTLTVTDALGCTSMQPVTITQSAGLNLNITSANPSCMGSGSAAVNATGGNSPYTYLWSNGQTTSAITNITAGNYSVIASDAGGCTSTATVTVSGTSSSITAVTSSNPAACNSPGNASVSATGGNSPYTYSWSNGQTTSTVTNLSAGNYTVTISDASGCTAIATVSVSGSSSPIANFTTGPVCLGSSTQFTNSSSGNPTSWSWNFGNGVTSTLQNSSNTYTAAGTYSVVLTVTDANGCSNTVTLPATVDPKPTAMFSPTSACFNNSTPFTDNSTGNPAQWFWDFGDGGNSVLQNPSHTYSAPGSYIVSLIVTIAGGCKDTIAQTVHINPLPNPIFAAPPVCIGTPSSFSDLSTISTGNITVWSWNFGDPGSGPANVSGLQNPSHAYSSAGSFSVILTVTSDSGCQGTIMLPVLVNSIPAAAFTSPNQCINTSSVFTDNSTGNPISWNWDFGDSSGNSAQQNPSHIYSSAGTYTITLIISSAAGCSDTTAGVVTIYPVPVPLFKADTVCAGTPTSFTDLSFITTGTITSWNWSFGDGGTSNQQNPSHLYASSGNFNVALAVTSNNGCIDTLKINTIVHGWPTADFCITPDKAPATDPVFNFCDQWSSDVVQWSWDFGDGDGDTINTDPIHSYSAVVANNDFYAFDVCVHVKNQYGCWDTVCKAVELIPEFTFYIPNTFTPNQDFMNETFFGKSRGVKEYTIWLFDRWGNLIWDCTYEGKNTDWDNQGQDGMSSYCKWDGVVVQGGMDMSGNSRQLAQEDVYVWKVELTDVFKKQHKYVGHVSIVK